MSRSLVLLSVLTTLLFSGCGGGGGSSVITAEAGAVNTPVTGGTPANCGDNCFLSAVDVEIVIAQAVAEAQARGVPVSVGVVDRVGNVLGVFETTDAIGATVTITSTNDLGGPIVGGIESLDFIPATLAVIAKAVTGAYLSTGGNAFSTRTASQIIQENFNPGEDNVPSGPLFGVQFSQLPCSDFSQRFLNGPTATAGPHRSPLGLAADPGGLPLYIDGTPVGAVGISADGIYGLDKNISDFDQDLDELIATAATQGYAAPLDIRANQITIVGKTAKFSDALVTDLMSTPADADTVANLVANNLGSYVAVTGYFDGVAARAGTTFGQPNSGIRPADGTVFIDSSGASLDAFIFVDNNDQNRYPAIDGLDAPNGDVANRLTAAEVQMVMNEAIGVANEARAQIRVPVGTQARVTVSVVDTSGVILGMGRTRDGPIFGADVSLQKARTATFFSGSGRTDGSAPADLLRGFPDPLYIAPSLPLATLATPAPNFDRYVRDVQLFLGDVGALEAFGSPVAFSDRSGGNLSRPNYPDGPSAGPPGPFSKPPGEWSIFSVGLQLDLSYNAVIHHLAFVFGILPDVQQNCVGDTGFVNTGGVADATAFTSVGTVTNLANGIQIFPGSVPIYRNDILIGGVGVSGDGVDQDDMISSLGLHRAGLRLNNGVGNAPPEIRADTIDIPGQEARLRYVNCPQLPFIGKDDTEVCDGI